MTPTTQPEDTMNIEAEVAEQSVLDYMTDHAYNRGWLAGQLGGMDIDPSMSVAQLREDLAIAQRARTAPGLGDADEDDWELGNYTDGFNAAVEAILHGAAVRVVADNTDTAEAET